MSSLKETEKETEKHFERFCAYRNSRMGTANWDLRYGINDHDHDMMTGFNLVCFRLHEVLLFVSSGEGMEDANPNPVAF